MCLQITMKLLTTVLTLHDPIALVFSQPSLPGPLPRSGSNGSFRKIVLYHSRKDEAAFAHCRQVQNEARKALHAFKFPFTKPMVTDCHPSGHPCSQTLASRRIFNLASAVTSVVRERPALGVSCFASGIGVACRAARNHSLHAGNFKRPVQVRHHMFDNNAVGMLVMGALQHAVLEQCRIVPLHF